MAEPAVATVPLAGPPNYTPLPGRARRHFGLFYRESQRLYLAPDHLFVVTTSRYAESYKRFYFADIQGLFIQKSIAGAVLNLVLVLFATLFAAIGLIGWLQLGWSDLTALVYGIIAMLWVVGLLINTILGPTCDVQILTAVHEEPLTCLGRLYTARRVVEVLRRAVEGVQGRAAITEKSLDEAAIRLNRAAHWHARRRRPQREEAVWPYSLFLSLTALDMAFNAVDYWYESSVLDVAGFLLFFAVATLALVLLIRQRHSDVPQGFRALIAFCLISFGVAIVLVVVMVFGFAVASESAEDLDSAMQRAEAVLDRVLNSLNVLFDMVIVTIGTKFLLDWRRRRSRRTAVGSAGLQQGGGAT